MAKSIREALELAHAAAGLAVPSGRADVTQTLAKGKPPRPPAAPDRPPRLAAPAPVVRSDNRRPGPLARRASPPSEQGNLDTRGRIRPPTQDLLISSKTLHPPPARPHPRKVAHAPPAVAPAKPAAVKPLNVSPSARLLLTAGEDKIIALAPQMELAGRQTQALVGEAQAQHEIALGVDFGTSSVKVVIGDSALGKSFVVPFGNHEGIEKYLLPSRLYQTGSQFSLAGGAECHRDLKLAFLAAPHEPVNQVRIVAFLALVIQRARAWLLTRHAQTYRRTQLFWKLSVGLPAAHYQDSKLFEPFKRLCEVAWAAAGQPAAVDEPTIVKLLRQPPSATDSDHDAEVMVVPEIAAQIYGYVVSNSFDRKAQNIFLMADVGAGTVDASLFHVFPARGGKWDFEFFTSVVRPHGVSNLHRHRVDWWTGALQESGAPAELAQQLLQFKFQTDQQCSIPNSFVDYFADVDVIVRKATPGPDHGFYDQTLAQVQGSALWRAWKDNLVSQQTLSGVPFFLSGGGARMQFYDALTTSMSKAFSSYSWLYATPRAMTPPDDLVIDDIARVDYDRLSVAYGLSRLELGRVLKALPMPKLISPPTTSWTDHYISKDLC